MQPVGGKAGSTMKAWHVIFTSGTNRSGPGPSRREQHRPLTTLIVPFLLVASLVSSPLALEAEAMKALTTAAGQTVLVPREVPDKSGFRPLPPLPVDGRLVLLLYDDPTTNRPVDYAEAYSQGGTLLSIAWYDKFGIRRRADDANLRDPNSPGPAGVFVMAIDPNSLL